MHRDRRPPAGTRALTVALIALLALATILASGCGSGSDDEGSGAPDERTAESKPDGKSTGGADSSDTTDAGDVEDPPTTDVDCAELSTAANNVALAIQLLPQVRTVDQIDDELMFADLEATRADIEFLRAVATGDSDRFLDDVEAGINAIEAGRNGDPDDALAEIERITGGVEGVQAWVLRQIDLGEDYAATGCEL
jgi:hypothetical protein